MQKGIDIHHHIIGKHRPKGLVLPEWSVAIDQEDMDQMGIQKAILSLPVAGKLEMVHAINQTLKQTADSNPGRYATLACLPLADGVQAVEQEMEYACKEMKAVGFCIPSNVQGIYLGDDRMDSILQLLDDRSAVVLLHPTKPATADENMFVKDFSIYEFPFDTTRAVMNLVYSGKIKRFPNIKWIISHAGGTIPFLAYRFSKIAVENKVTALSEKEIMDSLRSLYYDVALSTSDIVFSALKEFADPSHILFGTDYPLRAKKEVGSSVEELMKTEVFSEAEKAKILYDNAIEVFPDLR